MSVFPQYYRKTAFSLVELLVVVAILSMLASVGALGLQGMTGGSGVQGAVDLVAGIIEQARTEAIVRGNGSRVLINADPQSEGYLSTVAVLSGVRQSDGAVLWKLSSRPRRFPKQAFFFQDYSGGFGTMKFDFHGPGEQAGDQGTTCFYFEYDGRGALKSADPAVLSQLVFVNGSLEANGTLRVSSTREFTRGGFILRPAGNVTYFETPDQIGRPST